MTTDCTLHTHHSPEGMPAGNACSQDTIESLISFCLSRLPYRSIPPNWSKPDWRTEVEQVVALAVVQAVHDFVRVNGEDLKAFAFRKADGAARNAQRREWSFGRRSRPMLSAGDEHSDTDADQQFLDNDATGVDPVAAPIESHDDLHQALSELPKLQGRVLRLLFGGGLTQASAAYNLGLTRQAVSRLSRAALASLRKFLSDTGASASGAPGPQSAARRNSNIMIRNQRENVERQSVEGARLERRPTLTEGNAKTEVVFARGLRFPADRLSP